jgi:cyclophilin family peptidyl-prolyl cis-trans isomerase
LRDVIADALTRLGDGPAGQAARLLFGSVPDTAGQPLKVRRRLAGEVFGVQPDTFRKHREPDVVRDVAREILAAEHNPALAVINNPDPPEPPEEDTAPAPLQLVVASSAVVEALHATGPNAAPKRSARRWRGVEWVALAALAAVGIGWQWGATGVLRGLVVALVAALVWTLVAVVRERSDAGGIGRALVDRGPRLALLGATAVVAVGGIAALHDPTDTRRPPRDPCIGLSVEPQCREGSAGGPTTTATPQAELSPNYVPTTLAPVPAKRSPVECPPEGNRERRLSFVHGPPLWCIDPEADYEATIATNFGTFKVLLNTKLSPVAVNNFVTLARWRFYEGVMLEPSPEPRITATGMRATDPVAPDDTDKVPGYGLTFDHNTYPDLPVSDDERVYMVVTDAYKASRWAVILTTEGQNQVELEAERWPLIGQVACGVDVIANDSGTHDLIPAYTSAPIVIDHIDIRQLAPNAVPELHPREDCE